MSQKIRVTVWNEFRHEQKDAKVQEVYPKGIHQAIADFLGKEADIEVRTATLDEPENGLPQEVLDNTDVLFWWGHMAHGEVAEETVDRVQKRILSGMGLIVLHSGHKSKIFMRMLGTTADLRWREVGERERVCRTLSPDCRRSSRTLRDSAHRNVRRTFRYSPSGRHRFHYVV